MSVGLVVGVVGAIAVAITSPWWGPHLFGARWLAVATGCALGWLLYAVFNALNGAACGEQQWTAYALSVATDSGARLALVVAALGLGFGIVGQTWALALAGFAWVPLLAIPPSAGPGTRAVTGRPSRWSRRSVSWRSRPRAVR